MCGNTCSFFLKVTAAAGYYNRQMVGRVRGEERTAPMGKTSNVLNIRAQEKPGMPKNQSFKFKVPPVAIAVLPAQLLNPPQMVTM